MLDVFSSFLATVFNEAVQVPPPLHPPPGRSVPLIQENKTDTSALSGDQED